MMKRIRAGVTLLADYEKRIANDNNPAFHSAHEGYGVISEEASEAADALAKAAATLPQLLKEIQGNDPAWITTAAEDVKSAFIQLACEAIQAAAMAQKLEDMLNDV